VLLAEIIDNIAIMEGGVPDINVIGQQDLEWAQVTQLVIGAAEIMKKVHSPFQNIETATLWSEKKAEMDSSNDKPNNQPIAVCNASKFIWEHFKAMQLDQSKSKLLLIVPVMCDQK
jgi:hypothetical protein